MFRGINISFFRPVDIETVLEPNDIYRTDRIRRRSVTNADSHALRIHKYCLTLGTLTNYYRGNSPDYRSCLPTTMW